MQQTRVDTVEAYYRSWMKRFPSLRSLAEAPLQDVLKAWEGLGYYARARNAHRAARELVASNGGRFPRTFDGLRALPGVGPYTAAAIGSLALGLDEAVVDGNVIRVLTRLYGYSEDVRSSTAKARIQAWADAHLVPGRAGEVNEATMELGAMICTPRAPDCGRCPMRDECVARSEGDPEAYPVKAARAAVPHIHVGAGVIVKRDGRVLLAQRKEDAMLGGLWEFPGGRQEKGESLEECVARELQEELGIQVRVGPHLTTVRHAFSHFTMELHAYWVRIEKGRPRAIDCDDVTWATVEEIGGYPLPKADIRILDVLRKTVVPEF